MYSLLLIQYGKTTLVTSVVNQISTRDSQRQHNWACPSSFTFLSSSYSFQTIFVSHLNTKVRIYLVLTLRNRAPWCCHRARCSQTHFSMIDFLYKWVIQNKCEISAETTKKVCGALPTHFRFILVRSTEFITYEPLRSHYLLSSPAKRHTRTLQGCVWKTLRLPAYNMPLDAYIFYPKYLLYPLGHNTFRELSSILVYIPWALSPEWPNYVYQLGPGINVSITLPCWTMSSWITHSEVTTGDAASQKSMNSKSKTLF